MIRIELLPASYGDCILVEYGDDQTVHRILIDAGFGQTYTKALKPRLAAIDKVVPLELLVVTHIDNDHIRGILPLLEETPAIIKPEDVWFNGRQHLNDDELGPAEGEALAKLLRKKKLPWNQAFDGKAVVIPSSGELPQCTLAGGATITLLSPYRENLEKLARKWADDGLGSWDAEPTPDEPNGATDPKDDTLGAKREPLASVDIETIRDLADSTRFKEDSTAPNGSSIAFLFDYDGKRILFGADAHPGQLLRSLEQLDNEVVALDAFKLSHHGSMNNVSPALLAKIACEHFLVSSDGTSHGHPHPEAMAWVVTSSRKKKTLHFNYASAYTTVWDEPSTKKKFAYDVAYPDTKSGGIVVEFP